MAVAFRQPTFRNPLPTMLKAVAQAMIAVIVFVAGVGESMGRARAASELHRLGYTEEAKQLMLQRDFK